MTKTEIENFLKLSKLSKEIETLYSICSDFGNQFAEWEIKNSGSLASFEEGSQIIHFYIFYATQIIEKLIGENEMLKNWVEAYRQNAETANKIGVDFAKQINELKNEIQLLKQCLPQT